MHSLTWQQGLIVVGSFLAAVIVAKLIGHVVTRLVCRIVRAERAEVARQLRSPIVVMLALGLWQLALAFSALPDDARVTLHEIGRVGLVLSLVWLALRGANIVVEHLAARHALFSHHEASRALLPLGRRVAKILILAIAVVAVFGTLGYSITGLIAGLGIGGIAVALAAQKTLENVLGAFALGIDQPLREGDLVKVDQTVGTVERIGLRSTRVRTLDRTLVAIPNGKLADSVIERFSARDRYRFDVQFRLGLATTGAQLRAIRERIERLLADHPARADAEAPRVHLTGPGDTWFVVEAMAWFSTADFAEFQSVRDQLLLDCLEIIAQAGAALNGAPVPVMAAPEAAAPVQKPADDAKSLH
jgi:MscS family membrane protein